MWNHKKIIDIIKVKDQICLIIFKYDATDSERLYKKKVNTEDI